MNKVVKGLGVACITLIAGTAVIVLSFWYFKPININLFYQRYFLQYGLQDPELLSKLRILEPYGVHIQNRYFNDESPQAVRGRSAWNREQYAVFKSYRKTGFTREEQLTYDVFDYYLRTAVAGEPWAFYEYTLVQLFGIQTALPEFMINQHTIDSAASAYNYVQRLRQFQQKFDQVVAGLLVREKMHIIPPRFAIAKALEQMQSFVSVPAQQNILYTHFVNRLQRLPAEEVPSSVQRQLLQAALDAVQHSVYTAYEHLITYTRTLLPKATSNDGVWRLPNGDAYYNYLIQRFTTTNLGAEQIHQLGRHEVARLSQEIRATLTQLGVPPGPLSQRIRAVAQQPGQLYARGDVSPVQRANLVLKDFQTRIDTILPAMAHYFHRLPHAPIVVKRVPPGAEQTAAIAYYKPPAMDGSRPGQVFVNLRNLGELPRFAIPTLAYHEGVPGHHFQKSLTQEQRELPFFRRLIPFIAFTEGWALYAEHLAWEAGFLTDPMDNLGRLQAELFRAARLVVDTGLHAKRWTREQAIHYMAQHTGMNTDDVVAEVERYLVMPAQALAYKVGMIKILQLRQLARQALGPRFDIKDFHQQILSHGELPINLLEQVVEQWIARQQLAVTAGQPAA